MKAFKLLSITVLGTILLISSCKKDDSNNPSVPSNNSTNTNTNTTDSVTEKNIGYKASGSFIYTDEATSTPKTYTHPYVKVQYKDVSHIWSNTYYTYLTFYNTNSTAAAEMLTFVFLGKDFPKTGTYKIGPNIIASQGIKDTDKLLADEIGILAVGNSHVTKRDASMTLKVVNDKGKITITSDEEIKVYSNITGNLEGTCKSINFTRTTEKL